MAGRSVRSSLDPHLKRWLDPFFLPPFRDVRFQDGEALTLHTHSFCEALWFRRRSVAPTACAMSIRDKPTPVTSFERVVIELLAIDLHARL